MTDTYRAGDRVRIVAVHFRADDTGVVVQAPNLCPTYTVTVRVDRDRERYPFRPDELEKIDDAIRPEQAPDETEGQGLSARCVPAPVVPR